MTQIIVSSGQSSSGLTISGTDSLLVQSGGTVHGTVLISDEDGMGNGPSEEVQGSSIETLIENGSQTVDAGGYSLSATVGSDGLQFIANGGSASFTTIQGGGEVDVGSEDARSDAALAVITSATVLSGGTLDVYNRGVTSGAVVSAGGILDVGVGGHATNDTILSGGVLLVAQNGSASHETVNSGGLIVLHVGGVLTDTPTDGVLAGVVVTDDSGAIVSSWVQSGNATLDNIDLSTASSSDPYYNALNAFVAHGETVNGLTLQKSVSVDIEGTVNGLTQGYGNVFQSGVLTGVLNDTKITNRGGLVSGVTLTSAAKLQDIGGLVEQVTVQGGSVLTVGVPDWAQNDGDDDDDDDVASLPAAEASGIVIQSGGSLQVLSGGSISGGTISSGGFASLSAGASASDVTIADGGVFIRVGDTSVSGIHGTLAGLVVTDRNGAVNQVFFQSGNATLSNLSLDLNNSAFDGSTVTVGYGETINGLSLSGSNTYVTLNIAGVVSGLAASVDQTNLLAGGVLEGAVSKGSNVWGLSIGNSGGSISGATLNSGVFLNNTSGTIDGLTVASGATLSAHDMHMTGLVVQSGGTLQIDSAVNMGSAGGVLDVGAILAVGQGFSVTQSGGTLAVSSAGTVVQTYTLDASDGSPILLPAHNTTAYGDTAYTLVTGQVVSSGQTSSGQVISAGEVQMVASGGTSVDTTVLSKGQQLVQSGGVASGTTVQSGGLEILNAGGSAVGAVVSANGSEFVSAGGSSIQADIKTGGYQTVASGGTAVSATVEQWARQDISGGIASGTQVSGYQYLNGGRTVSSVVASGGTEYVYAGKASATRIQSAGQLAVNPSGSAVGAVVENGGSLTDSGGVLRETTVQSGGSLQVNGSAFFVWNNGSSVQSYAIGSAHATTVLSGGVVKVGAGGSISGDTISSGGFVYLSAGASASDETIADGGVLIREGNTSVSNIHGALAGLVVADRAGTVTQAFFQSGDATLSNITLDVGNTDIAGGTVIVGYGETVKGLTLSGSASYAPTLQIAGVVSGLQASVNQVGLLSGGVLAGSVTMDPTVSYGVWIQNSGGTVSGVTLNSGVFLNNISGTIDGLTVASGATLSAYDMHMTGLVVQSGGTLRIDTAANIGSAGGVLDIGATLAVGQGFSVTQSGSTLTVASSGTVVQTYTLDTPTGSPVLLPVYGSGYGETTYLLAAGQLVTSGQTSSGQVISGGEVQIVASGGTSLDTTVFSNGRQFVQSGGVASGTTVQSGGLEVLSAGASGVAAVVSYSGSEFVSAGASSIQTDVRSGGYQTVASGGTAVSATVEHAARQDISGGIASGTQVSGYQYLNGGQTVSSVVASGGTEYVQAGTASATHIQSAGQLAVNPSGSAVGAVVENGGSLTDIAGVLRETTVQSGGSLQVNGSAFSVWSNDHFVQSQALGSASATTVLSGGMMLVGAGGRASGDVISSGGYVEVRSGGIISNETVQQGGLIILDQGGTVLGTNTSGVLAGVVVWDGSGSLVSAIVQSGDNTVRSLDLTSLGGNNVNHTVLVAAGETVSALSIGSSGLNSNYNTLSIGGVVSGLAARNVNTTVLSGGALEGDITLAGSSENSWETITVFNQGGTVSGATLHSGVTLTNISGTASDIIVQSGASFNAANASISNILVKSGATISLDCTGGTGQTGGTLETGVNIRNGYGKSATIENGTLLVLSSGTVLERFNVAVSSDALPGEVAILPGGGTQGGQITQGYVVSAGQTSAGLSVPAGDGLQVLAGGTSINATLSAPGNAGSGATEEVWGSSLSTHLQSQTQQTVHSGGVSLEASILGGGTQVIEGQGVASGTVLSGYYAGEAVQAGGSAVNTTLSDHASQAVYSGGTVTATSVGEGGSQTVYGGTALNTKIASDGVEYVYQSGLASGSVIQSGGSGFVENQGRMDGFEVENGGALKLFDGTLQHGVVHSGGLLDLEMSFGNGTSSTVSDVTLDLGAHLRFGAALSGHVENDMLLLTSGGVTLESFAINNLPPNAGGENLLLKEVTSGYQTYYELDDGTPCYCPGTLIATTRGEVAVEDLKIGDRVVTASGKRRPIRWIGNRAYSGRFAATNPDVLPVLFRAGSLGAGACGEPLPRRDLMVSPLHAMYLDGVLVPAQALVNGTSIVRLAQVDEVAYFHIELKTHDILLAEGAPAESFVDDDSRGMFHNAHEYARLYPTARPGAVQYCAPRVEEGPQLEALRQRLNSLPVAHCTSRVLAG